MSANGSQPTYTAAMFNQYTIAFEGANIAAILFGMYLALAGTNITLLRKKRYRILLSYTIFQLVLTLLYFAVSLYAGPAQSMSIFNLYSDYSINALSPWPSVVVNVAFVLNTWASDSFLLYRCYIIYMANKYAFAVPALVYFATVGASLAWLIVSSSPGAVYSTHAVQVAGLCFWCSSAATNVCASTFISARLWLHRRAVTRAVGSPQGTFYLSLMAMTLESALMYTVFVIVALVAFVLNSPLVNVFFPVLGTIQVIAPSLIIYRIARGISFETDEYGTIATGTIRFASSTLGPDQEGGHGKLQQQHQRRWHRSRGIGGMLRPTVVVQDVTGLSEAMHVSSVGGCDDGLSPVHDSASFLHDIKGDIKDKV